MSTDPQPGSAGGVVNLGLRLRQARMATGLTLRELARQLGVSPSFVSQLENGKSQPSVATLYSLAQLLGLSIDKLFEAQAVVPGSGSEAASTSTADVASALGARAKGQAAAAVGEGPGNVSLPAPDVPPVVAEPAGTESSVSRTQMGAPRDAWQGGESRSRISVTAPGNRARLVMDCGVVWEQLARNTDHNLDFIEIVYPPGSSSTNDGRMLRHEGYEYGYLLEGELEVTVGFDVFRLRAGEALGLDSSLPHLFRNPGDIPARGVWFVHHRHD